MRNFTLAAVAALLLTGTPAGQLQAATCEAPITCEFSLCRTPALPAPSSLWGELRPAETAIPSLRDSTDQGPKESFSMVNPLWVSIDAENGYIFTAATSGFEIWDARTNPDNPEKLASVDGRKRQFPMFPASLEEKIPVTDIDAPAGDDRLFAVSAVGEVGLTIWDSAAKTSPVALYQDFGFERDVQEVYAAKIGGRRYVFAAAGNAGLRAYDMDAALTASPRPCVDEAPANRCGVFVRTISSNYSGWVSGAGDVIASSKAGLGKGVEVFNVADPSNPVLVGTFGSTDSFAGHTMWSENGGAKLYLAVATFRNELRVYDVSCAASKSCTPGAPIGTAALTGVASFPHVTGSKSGSTQFVHVGQASLCGGDKRQEWLFDLSNPGAPREVTPQQGVAAGYLTDYWMWYHRSTQTGFNWVAPQRAVFYGDRFYRAALGIFDIHKLGSAKPNPDFNWSPSKIFVGTSVNFTDASTGAPTSWAWGFSGGSPVSSFLQNPAGVMFNSVGTKTVTLDACNDKGCASVQKTLLVEAAEAAVTAVTVSPASLSSCLTATFTATGVTGMEPFTYEWAVRPPAAADIPLNCTGNPCAWVVDPALASGSYQVLVTVRNAQNTTGAVASKAFTLSQQTLGFVSGPTSDPTTTGTVQFHVQTTGAKEWSWDFGTGAGWTAYSADPVNGPNPKFSYTVTGVYSIKVRIRDCNGQVIEYPTPLVLSVTAMPLEAKFEAQCFFGYCAFDAGMAIAINDLSTGTPDGWAYDWTHSGTDPATCIFGNYSATPVTSRTYSSAGTFQPCLRVKRGTDTSVFVHEKAITISNPTPPPTPSVSISGASSGLTNQAINFSASASNCSPSASGWRWTIGGGGSGSSTSSSIAITWTTTGTKSVSVTNTSCGSASSSKSVTISSSTGGTTLTAQYTYSPASPTPGQAVSFNGSSSQGSPTSYTWSFGDGGTADGAQAQHTFAANGYYQVRLTVSKPGTGAGCFGGYCSDDEVKTIFVSGGQATTPPTAAYTYTPNPVYVDKNITFDASPSTESPTSFIWNFGDGTGNFEGKQVVHKFTKAGSYQVKLTVSKPGTGAGCFGGFCSDDEIKTVAVGAAQTGLCEDDPSALCLNSGRFKVTTAWKKPDGKSGKGQPIGITDDTGYFWFEYASNVEVVAKVLDGCAVNSNRWVFATGLTNVEVTMTVTDKVTGAVQTYVNPQGKAFDPIQDTKAFSCNAGAKVEELQWAAPTFSEPTEWIEIQDGDPRPVGKAYAVSGTMELAPNATCNPDSTALCLNGSRFRVEAWWATETGVGAGQAVPLGGDTGYFWFFDAKNVELIIKVLNGCDYNSRYWVFAGGLTNVEVRIMVTDMMTGKFKEYVNPKGTPFPAYQDTDAISECF